jgi:hypothetical protein
MTQVPEWVRGFLPSQAVAFVYGGMLGLGFITLFTYSAHVAMLASVPLLLTLPEVLLVMLLFAVGKSLVLASSAGTRTLTDIDCRVDAFRARGRLLRLAMGALSIATAVVIVEPLHRISPL